MNTNLKLKKAIDVVKVEPGYCGRCIFFEDCSSSVSVENFISDFMNDMFGIDCRKGYSFEYSKEYKSLKSINDLVIGDIVFPLDLSFENEEYDIVLVIQGKREIDCGFTTIKDSVITLHKNQYYIIGSDTIHLYKKLIKQENK